MNIGPMYEYKWIFPLLNSSEKKYIYKWLSANIKNEDYIHYSGEIVFRNKDDAMRFKLVWG